MYNYNIKKNKRILILFLLTITISFLNFNLFMWNLDNSITDEESSTKFQPLNKLKTSSYPQTFGNSGEDINVTLHQSYVNSSFDTIVNTSIVNGNNFTLPCPTDTWFNSSYTNITVKDIFAPNRSISIEEDSQSDVYMNSDIVTSFTINQVGCYLINASFNIFVEAGTPGISVYLYNSTLGSPDTSSVQVIGSFSTSTPGWNNVKLTKTLLNNTETENNKWYIGIKKTDGDPLTACKWRFDPDPPGGTDGSNDSDAFSKPGVSWNAEARDYTLKIYISPIDKDANPSDIGLKINGDSVTNMQNGKGYWESTKINSSATGELKYNVTADWWDIECNISQVLINYTKTDLTAGSSFDVSGSGQDIAWNVTRNGGFNYFGTDFSNYRINFTIPATWHDSSIKVFNGSDEWSINKRLLGNGYREVMIPNAGNGTYWFLNATSDNLLFSINTYVDGNAYNIVNYTNVVRFNGTFTEVIDEGILNLSVYSPSPYYLNHTNTLNISQQIPGTEFFVYDWDISDNATEYGVFITRMAWNNGTAAGFLIGDLTILGESELKVISPLSFTFDASETFDLILFFNDTGQNPNIKNVTSADIQYKINDGAPRTDSIEIGEGLYNITFVCNDTDFTSNGPNVITINASYNFYNNQSKTIDITIIGETSLTIINPSAGSNFNSSEVINLIIEFNNTIRDEIITNPIINYSLNGGIDWRHDNIGDIGDNKYNILIDCNDTQFGNYGPQFIIVNTSKQYYYNQSEPLSITITGDTTLYTTEIFPDPSIGYYNSDETFNITVYFEDNGRNEGIIGGNLEVHVKEVSEPLYNKYTTVSIVDIGAGYYNITIECNNSLFYPYGKFDIKFNITKSNYYTAEEILTEIVFGNTTLTILDPIGPISYVENEIFDIQIEYEDHTLSSGILGADITYTIDGNNYLSVNVTDNLDGTYNITIYAGHTDFDPNYGNVDIIIRANKTNYINLTRSLTFERQIITQIEPLNPPSLIEVIRGNSVFYTFNYSDRLGTPIDRYDTFQNTTNLQNFEWNIVNDGAGNYTLELNTSKVLVIETPYTINFSIYAFGNQSQEISFTILVTIIQTSIEIQSWNSNSDFARSTWTNVSINFHFKDTTNNAPIDGLLDSDVKIKDYYAGTTWLPGFELFTELGPGNYKLNISTVGKNSGLYTIQLNISKYPNYNWSLAYIQFYLRGNYTQINMISVSDPEAILTPTGIGNNYTTFLGSDLTVEFNITDTEFNNNVLIEFADEYIITFKNLYTGITGTLQENLVFNLIEADYGIHTGSIITSELTDTGFYLINITVVMLNYENTTFSFNLTLVNSQINIISISNLGGQLEPFGTGDYYNSSIALDISLEFNITDNQALNKIIARDADSYLVRYINLGTGQNGTVLNNFAFNSPTSTYIGIITTSGLPVGNYLINVSVVILDYKVIPLTFNLTIVSADSYIIFITNVGGQLSPTGVGGFYEPTVATDIDIEFNTTDAYFGNIIQIEPGVSYTIYYTNIDTNENGTILHSIAEGASSHFGSLDISSFSIGNYSVTIIINKSNNIVSILSFKLRIVYANSSIISITNLGGQLEPSSIDNFYDTFIGSNIGIEFNILDAHFGTTIQIGAGISYSVYYQNIDTLESGTLQHTLSEIISLHSGSLNVSLLPVGNYSFSIIVAKSTSNVTLVNFLLRIVEKYETRITVYKPESVNAGLPFTIIIKAEYFNGTVWLPTAGSNMTITLCYNGGAGESQDYYTNSTGEIEIIIPTYSDTITLNLTIQLISAYYHQGYGPDVSDIDIIPIPLGFGFEDILPYLIIAGIAIAAVGGSVGIYRGVVVPKKREKARVLKEVKTIFDDAISLEHILVLYKGTGTCIFFKSFGSEGIDPELISGFISAICSFGKDLVCQEELNEITYGDKMLLLSDGEFIRVALVLSKKASIILRKNLMDFINGFEKSYASELPNWRGQLNVFRNAGRIVDEILSTSIILPHEITYEFSNIKALKSPHSKDVLKVANTLVKDSDRTFFFIATLLKEATEKTHKDTAEIFMGIKELRDKKILIPIEIGAIEAQPISQQELVLINQKVAGLVNLSQEEKQKLVNDLAQVGPAEREAYFASLMEQHAIVSAPIEEKPGAILIDNVKGAKKEIRKLKKMANTARKEKDYGKTINIYQNAARIATSWELTGELEQLNEFIRLIKIVDLRIKMKTLEKEAKLAAKEEKYNEAAQKYKMSSKIASEIFKLGGTELTKEVKRLSNKSKEYEKLI